MCAPKAPKPPDPYKTAEAQTGQNVSTAIANNTMQMADQYTPEGSLTNQIIGYETVKGPNGESYQVPKYSQTTSLSQDQQKIYDNQTAAKIGMGDLANNQINFLGDYMSRPFDGNTDAVEGRLMELGSKRLAPQFAQREDALRGRLLNQGLTEGSEGWNREMTALRQQENDAYNQLLLTGRGQAQSEALALRNQPINEITALLSGSQVSHPNVQGVTPQAMPNVDVAGLINQNYNQRLGAWQQEAANRGSLMGGLFKLGGSFLL